MKKNISMEKLGKAGEIIYINHCIQNGKKVVISENQFDPEKDVLIDDLKVEVKTQVPFVVKNSFTIKENQLRKCKSVDSVIFVSVPNKTKKHFSDGKVYQIKSKEMKIDRFTTSDGRDMILIPINQKGMKELFTLSQEQCKILQSYSISTWN